MSSITERDPRPPDQAGAGTDPAATASGRPGDGPPPPQSGSARTPVPASRTGPHRSELVTERGRTSIADSVVAKIAGLAAREVTGVHEMGAGMSRTLGALRDRIGPSSDHGAPDRGVSVEVGERQAAIDIDVVVEYGAAIVDVAESVRRNVIDRIEDMTGLEVIEVNITVDDIYLGETSAPPQPPRVQ